MKHDDRPDLTLFEGLVLGNLRDIKDAQLKTNDKLDDLSIRVTRLEDGHLSNDDKINCLELKINKHIDQEINSKKEVKKIIYTSIFSFIFGGGLLTYILKFFGALK